MFVKIKEGKFVKAIITRALVITVIINAFAIFGAGMQKNDSQSKQDSTASSIKSPASKGLQFSAKTVKESFSLDEPIVLKVSVRNDTRMTFYLPDTFHPEWDYKLEVKNEKRENVPLTADGERLMKDIAIFRQVNKEIAPGDQLQRDFQINKLFKMADSGSYAITVSHQAWDPKRGEFITITSNTVKVRVK